MEPRNIRGRGAAYNPENRFEGRAYVPDEDHDPSEDPSPHTVFLPDRTKSIIARNDSPDVGFDASINPYRGCEHGCAYCYARPTHEYLGYSAGLDFETKILVKEDAPELLRRELSSAKWEPRVLGMCGVTDCYQPVEKRLQLTRRCLQVLAEFRNPVMIVTKNRLVARDIDVLSELARHRAAGVFISVTTLDVGLNRILEPRTSLPAQRLQAMEALARAGIPVGVLIGPVIPALNDHEIPAIVEAAAKAGACCAGHEVLRLPHAVAPLFEDWLARHLPERKERILNRVRSMRGGKLNVSEFGVRMRGIGPYAQQIEALFTVAARKAGILDGSMSLSTSAFRRPDPNGQLTLFQD